MMFYCDINDNICEGIVYMTEDTSVIFKYDNGMDCSLDYTVSLGDSSRFLIDLSHKTGKCGPLRCFMNGVKVTLRNLEVPQSKKGELHFIDDNEMEQYGGTTYILFEDTCYYDEFKNILCIGNCNKGGETVEFVTNTFAVVNQNVLVAIFMKVEHLQENILIRKGRFYK